jgi:hypothetical protein
MARKVYVSSDMSNDERLIEIAEKDYIAALIWPWLLTGLDDWGRAEASPRRIKAHLFPMFESITLDIITKALDLLAEYGLIESYGDPKKPYMAVAPEKWFKYQTHVRAEKRTHDGSKLPPQPGWEKWVAKEKTRTVTQSNSAKPTLRSTVVAIDEERDRELEELDREQKELDREQEIWDDEIAGMQLVGKLFLHLDPPDVDVCGQVESFGPVDNTLRILLREGVDSARAERELVPAFERSLAKIGRESMEVVCVDKKPNDYKVAPIAQAFCDWMKSDT